MDKKECPVPRVKFPRLKLTVIKKEGYCYHNYDVGDELILDDFTHPPKDFCLGLAKSAFSCLYALTFGASFGFMENTKSINTTCPDNAKLSFKIEVLDDKGKVTFLPQKEKPKGPNPKTFEIEVEEVRGYCHYGYKKGDIFKVKGLKTPEGFCGAAYSVLFPVLFALNFGASFSFEKDPDCKTGTACPDNGYIKFKVRRLEQ
ncbi:MAG: TIGR04076 family protein [Candidatus Omnitrophica bacterium]|nr:TIGR04076 family protein [Candidatus Omnitrophota bacterium]